MNIQAEIKQLWEELTYRNQFTEGIYDKENMEMMKKEQIN